MRIGVPRETTSGERRVALVPESVGRLVKAGIAIVVEQGAGDAAGFPDAAYAAAGATPGSAAAAFGGVDLVLKVQAPTPDEAAQIDRGAIVVAFLAPHTHGVAISALQARGVTGLAVELVPRTTLAQSMDVLSSQATIAGYKAVLLGAAELPRILPMLTTAAGTLAPARAFVIGAGVAGLQAIATARRLGAVVSGFDVRAAAREQIESLGARSVGKELETAEGAGGYAREVAADQQARIEQLLAAHLKDQDLVITTAQIPGKPAPRLLTAEMVRTMRPGSVIVDLAAETGGNCVHTRAGETVRAGGVSILGPVNVAASVPSHASQMLSRNLTALAQRMVKDGTLVADAADEVVGPMIVTRPSA
ncbi:MAG TPA: NAD(P) transhydrogenase subunit alpha [Gemmatimonadales bacterium]|nr:NAD(P) transhydrogenase subunit alpha [Gemmatimonadales bacterium]